MSIRWDLSGSRFTHIVFCSLTFLALFLCSSIFPRTGLAESITAVGSEGLSARAHVNIKIIIPERIDVNIPAAIETDSPGGGDQRFASNSGPLSVTVDQNSYTYVGATKIDVLRLSTGETGALGSEPPSVPENGSHPSTIPIYTIASP